VQAHRHRLGHPRRVVDARSAERDPEDRLDTPAVLRVEPIARHEDEARQEPSECVPANEQAHTLALAQVQDPDHDPEQLVDVYLEELVARMSLQDLDQRLLVVASAGKGGAREHRVELAPEDRDLVRAGAIGAGRVQPQEAPLPDDPA
jgi:hypothetical protein